jgi:GT2 family glycosyltransferase
MKKNSLKNLSGVTTITPSYNDKEKVFRLLDSIKKCNYPKIESIVVVGDTGDTISEGRKKYPSVKWISSGPVDVGQTGRYNIAMAYANKKNHLLYVDSDVIFEKDMIHKLIERLEGDNKIGIVTPMILYLEDKDWVNQAGATVDLWTGKVTVGWGPKKDWLEAKEVQNSGTVMLFKREMIDKIGWFEDWYMCYFDPDYCLRGKQAGYSTWYEPKAICYHDQPKDSDKWEPRVLGRAWLLGKNRTLFMRKHGKNIFVYILFLPILFAYYLRTSIKYGIFPKWLELIWGTVAGFFSPVTKDYNIPIPTVVYDDIRNKN